MPEFVDIGPECFADVSVGVISWKGENYYKACDEPVVTNPDGSDSHCVKRVDHPGDIHEDFDGFRKTEPQGRTTIVVSFPTHADMKQGHETTQRILQELKPHFKDQPEVKVYGAVLDKADQIIMLLNGEG